ncbi:MAG: amidohydrolase family protein [Bacteroidota bacterium]
MKKYYYTMLLVICFGGFCQKHRIIQNVQLFDGEEVKEKVDIEIINGHFSQISTERIEGVDHVELIDGTGKTLLPGLINAHVHAWSKSQLKLALQEGVFALLDMHAPEQFIDTLREMELSSSHAKYYSAGYAATVASGHGTQYGYKIPAIGEDVSPETFVNQRKENGSDYIKITYEPSRPTLSLSQIEELIQSAHDNGLLAIAHISNLKNALEIASLKVDALAHVWDDQVITPEEVEELKKQKLFVVPTLTVHERSKKYYDENDIENEMLELDDICRNVQLLHHADIPILAGTDPLNFGINYGSSIHRELKLLVRSGLSPTEALKAATSNPAIHFNLEDLGFIKVGMPAHFILITGNPIKNIDVIKNLESIWIDGEQIQQ